MTLRFNVWAQDIHGTHNLAKYKQTRRKVTISYSKGGIEFNLCELDYETKSQGKCIILEECRGNEFIKIVAIKPREGDKTITVEEMNDSIWQEFYDSAGLKNKKKRSKRSKRSKRKKTRRKYKRTKRKK